MPIVHVTRRARFNAAHRLFDPNKSDEWNLATFGKCSNPNWHGHNYELEVTVAGEPDPATGFVIDLSELKQLINTYIVEPCDHKNLNIEVPFMEGIMPTTENLAVAVWKQLEDKLPSGRLHCVHLKETENNAASYYGE